MQVHVTRVDAEARTAVSNAESTKADLASARANVSQQHAPVYALPFFFNNSSGPSWCCVLVA